MSKFSEWLRPALTVPRTSWSSGESNWKTTPKSFFVLVLGLWLFGTGEAAFIAANIGVSPWVVFAEGISLNTGWSIGQSTFVISCSVLAFWIPLKSKPGLGTIMNIIVIALALDVMAPLYPHPDQLGLQIALDLFGIILVGIGSALYITSNLGPGPRDGLMTGLHYQSGIRIGRVRMMIEIAVLIVGWRLGGTVGVGTVLFAGLIGQSIALSMGVVSRLAPQAR
jgi:uncharacterized membrane protein YczE